LSDQTASATLNNLTRDEARERRSVIDSANYVVHFDFTGESERFPVKTTITFPAKEGAETFVDYTAPAVTKLVLNGEELSTDSFDGNRISISGLRSDNTLEIHSESEYSRSGVGIYRFEDPADGNVYIYSDFEPFDAHRAYPCFDQPDIKGTFDFSVDVPEGCIAISNYKPVSKPEDGASGRWVFGRTAKISAYITNICAGPYHGVFDRHGEIDLGLYCRRSIVEYLDAFAPEMFEITKQGFDFFQKAFDYPYPFDKYDQIFVPDFNSGAMENAGAVTYNELYLPRAKATETDKERLASTVLHEMAHMWFGDLVTMKWWDDLWLNESFADYAAYVSASEGTRFEDAWVTFLAGRKVWAYDADQLPTTHPITVDIPDTASTKANFDGISYAKGGSVLKQLASWIGREKFDEGLRNYFRKHEFSNTELSDFLQALSETSGIDLSDWSKQWLETAGVNTLRPVIETDGDKISSFKVIQDASEDFPTLRSHRIWIGLYDGDDKLELTRRAEVEVSGNETNVEDLVGAYRSPLILLNDGDVAYVLTELDDASLETASARISQIEDPLARALLWLSQWEMLREAKLPAADYVNTILRHIASEPILDAVSRLLFRAQGALTVYGSPSNWDKGLGKLANFAYDQLVAAEAGSDLQLTWFGGFVSAASRKPHHEILQRLLSGDSSIEGLDVSQDLRWSIIHSLVAAGVMGAEGIDDELKEDATDSGRRQAAASHASIPTAEAKAETWSAIVDDPELSLAMMRAHFGSLATVRTYREVGFHRFDQPELLRPFVDPYFDKIREFWEKRPYEMAMSFVSLGFPRTVIEESTIDKIDAFLASWDAPFPIRRTLTEWKSATERALRTRALDFGSPGS
jgi:aminopeptidase N